MKANMSMYENAKKTFQYFSSEKLVEIYENAKTEDKEDFEILALEEELVRRKILAHSPMHEKLYHIRKFFES